MVIDSALFIIMSECADSNEGFLEGELAMAKKIIPYAKAHSAELSLFKQSEIFCQYAMLCGQQGKERFEDAQALNSQALDFARRAKDYYMIHLRGRPVGRRFRRFLFGNVRLLVRKRRRVVAARGA